MRTGTNKTAHARVRLWPAVYVFGVFAGFGLALWIFRGDVANLIAFSIVGLSVAAGFVVHAMRGLRPGMSDGCSGLPVCARQPENRASRMHALSGMHRCLRHQQLVPHPRTRCGPRAESATANRTLTHSPSKP